MCVLFSEEVSAIPVRELLRRCFRLHLNDLVHLLFRLFLHHHRMFLLLLPLLLGLPPVSALFAPVLALLVEPASASAAPLASLIPASLLLLHFLIELVLVLHLLLLNVHYRLLIQVKLLAWLLRVVRVTLRGLRLVDLDRLGKFLLQFRKVFVGFRILFHLLSQQSLQRPRELRPFLWRFILVLLSGFRRDNSFHRLFLMLSPLSSNELVFVPALVIIIMLVLLLHAFLKTLELVVGAASLHRRRCH